MFRKVNICLLILASFIGMARAQERYLDIQGVSELDMEPLARATVNLYEGTTKVKSVQTGSDGSFSLRLDVNKQYVIEVEKEGLISKRISFDTHMPDDEKGSWMNKFSMGLLKPCSGVDYGVLKEPVDRISFDTKRREFLSDRDYMGKMRQRIETMMIKNDQCMMNTYETLVKKADQQAGQKNYNDAIDTYREALKIFPREEYPAKRIAEMNAQMNRQQNMADVYQKIIAEADALLAQQNLTAALEKYKQASGINPQESYPKQKAATIQSTLAQQQAAKQAQQDIEDRYNQAMAKASVAYTRKDYSTAKQYYQEALTIKPAESLPKTRVQEIETIEAKKAAEEAARAGELAKKEAFEKEYHNLVTQADEQFRAGKYDEARATYVKASAMKPGEAYPAQRIKAVDKAVASEQAALERKKEDEYNTAIAAANNALAQNQFSLAKESFQKALTIMPDDLAARNKLAEVDRLADEYAKHKAIDDQYTKLIQKADASLAKKEYDQARETYTQALSLKPGDQYAQTRINVVDNLAAAEQAAALKAQNDSYNAVLASGNNALVQNQFEVARESFQKALNIKPGDKVASDRLAETNRLADEFAKNKAIDEQYRKIISTADGFMAAKDFSKARESYVQALSLKQGDQYAQTRITSIDNTIAAEEAARLRAIEDGYQSAIGGANTAITQQSYTQAKQYLHKALDIKPGDAYATGRLMEVERLIQEEQKKLEQEKLVARQYSEAIASADKAYDQHDFASAKTAYNRALQIRPGDAYANQRLSSIDNILAAEEAAKVQQFEEAYTKFMNQGNAALIARDYPTARNAFQQALVLKPADNSARAKLSETDLLIRQEQDRIVAEQARKKKYDDLISTADQYFQAKKYPEAKTAYDQALSLLPGEAYPRQRLDEIARAVAEQERLTAEEKARESAYNLALVSADKYYKAKDYEQARDEYGRASSLKPDEAFPKTRLAEMENLIRARQQEQEKAKARANAYTAAINAGNSAFAKKDYPAAKSAYMEALKHMPGDRLATDQVEKINYLMAEAERIRKEEEERQAAYQALITSADGLYDNANYTGAKDNYKKALALQPNSTYAKQRIARIDEILRALSKTPARTSEQSAPPATKVTAAIPMGELNFRNESERQRYFDELKNKYPVGITLEKYKEKYKETYRYIIIRDDQAQEFRYIRFLTYNGAQYSMDGKPITQQYFGSQVKPRDGEGFKEIDMQ